MSTPHRLLRPDPAQTRRSFGIAEVLDAFLNFKALAAFGALPKSFCAAPDPRLFTVSLPRHIYRFRKARRPFVLPFLSLYATFVLSCISGYISCRLAVISVTGAGWAGQVMVLFVQMFKAGGGPGRPRCLHLVDNSMP